MKRVNLRFLVLVLLLAFEFTLVVFFIRKISCLERVYSRQLQALAKKRLIYKELRELEAFVSEAKKMTHLSKGDYSTLLQFIDKVAKLQGVSSVGVQPVPLYKGGKLSGSYVVRVSVPGWSSFGNLLNFVLDQPLMCSLGNINYAKGKIKAEIKINMGGK